MDNSAGRILVLSVILAVCAGIVLVALDPDYRPKKIAETNRGVFSNIETPQGAPADAPQDAPAQTEK